jgi:hypothetical protein
VTDPRGPQPPNINPSLRAPFRDPVVQKAVAVLQKELAVLIPEAGFQRACLGKGPTGICVQIVCVVTGRDPGIWTFEVWCRPDGSWQVTYENKQGGTGRAV